MWCLVPYLALPHKHFSLQSCLQFPKHAFPSMSLQMVSTMPQIPFPPPFYPTVHLIKLLFIHWISKLPQLGYNIGSCDCPAC